MMDDPRNVADKFKGMTETAIVSELDEHAVPLEIAFENTLRDYNMGSIVRTANAFGVRTVHIIGRRQWNKRGAMKTDAYMHVMYHSDFTAFTAAAHERSLSIIAIDNVPGAIELQSYRKKLESILLFGQEGPGLSDEALRVADAIVSIEQYGSTRSLNVAAAAAVVIYQWRHA